MFPYGRDTGYPEYPPQRPVPGLSQQGNWSRARYMPQTFPPPYFPTAHEYAYMPVRHSALYDFNFTSVAQDFYAPPFRHHSGRPSRQGAGIGFHNPPHAFQRFAHRPQSSHFHPYPGSFSSEAPRSDSLHDPSSNRTDRPYRIQNKNRGNRANAPGVHHTPSLPPPSRDASPEVTIEKPLDSSNLEPVSGLHSTTTSTLSSHSIVHHNLREKLIDHLRAGTYQCLICISNVRQRDSVWSCTTCYHIYHLPCIKSWAQKCTSDSSTTTTHATWRCPSCQTKQLSTVAEINYVCFCRRIRDPEYHPARTSIPHGCDEVCGKIRTKSEVSEGGVDHSYVKQTFCTHPCTELCHPGPCPPCTASVSMSCPCGRVQRAALCGDKPPAPCGQLCGRQLGSIDKPLERCACKIHTCLFACHEGLCPPCIWIIETGCYCGKEHNRFSCGGDDALKLNLAPDTLEQIYTAMAKFHSSTDERLLVTKLDKSLTLCSTNSDSILEVNDSPAMAVSTPAPKTHEAQSTCDAIETQTPLAPLLEPPAVSVAPSFSCGGICGQPLACGNHSCPDICHTGECKPCALDPSRCFTCPCGRIPLSKLVLSNDPAGDRRNCSDPVPTCPNECARPHPLCGHPCPKVCHSGPCNPCELSIVLKCRCGRTSKELKCVQFEELAHSDGVAQLLCERVCKKKKVCGRHKCKLKCCDLTSHPCNEVCERLLTCRRHVCEEPCHPGPCGSCWRGVIYTEIYCRCGSAVLHPPQPCGSSPPECTQPCDRPHDCAHPVRHTCHNEPTCPPCAVLLTKECPGGHGVQFSVPCFQPVLTCGRVCGKPLPQCSHFCTRLCHVGSCLTEPDTDNAESATSFKCSQPCQKPRSDCGHACNLPCHEAEGKTCLQAALSTKFTPGKSLNVAVSSLWPRCQYSYTVVCPCGNRKAKQTCHQVQLKRCIMAQQDESSVRPESILNPSLFDKRESEPLKLLACDHTCTEVAQQAPSTSGQQYPGTAGWKRGFDQEAEATIGDKKDSFDPPEYSDFLRQYALHNYAFALSVERQLYNMVLQFWQPLKSSKGEPLRSLEHHFAAMGPKRRRFVRELCEFYGIEAYTMDPEPKRHIMVLAKRGSIRLPGDTTDHRYSLTNCLKRDFPGTIRLREGVTIPKKPVKKYGPPPLYTAQSTYASILANRK
ncbi:unnamed protein product [Dicrocoelium dendriticum]|nr:unnamed protein product [Dicrocoelium dendriticum]